MSSALHDHAMHAQAERLLQTTRAYFATDLDRVLSARAVKPALAPRRPWSRDGAQWALQLARAARRRRFWHTRAPRLLRVPA